MIERKPVENPGKPDEKAQRFVDLMVKLKAEGKLLEYFREMDRLAEEQDPDSDWDVLLR